MPPKQSFFRVTGVLITNQNNSDHDFSMFMKAIDENHAVILVREHLKNNETTSPMHTKLLLIL